MSVSVCVRACVRACVCTFAAAQVVVGGHVTGPGYTAVTAVAGHQSLTHTRAGVRVAGAIRAAPQVTRTRPAAGPPTEGQRHTHQS